MEWVSGPVYLSVHLRKKNVKERSHWGLFISAHKYQAIFKNTASSLVCGFVCSYVSFLL